MRGMPCGTVWEVSDCSLPLAQLGRSEVLPCHRMRFDHFRFARKSARALVLALCSSERVLYRLHSPGTCYMSVHYVDLVLVCMP